MHSQTTRAKYNLPERPFFYTVDQLQDLLQMDPMKFLHYEGRSVGPRPKDKLLARNLAPRDQSPEWRVEEKEFIRWMRFKKIIPAQRGTGR